MIQAVFNMFSFFMFKFEFFKKDLRVDYASDIKMAILKLTLLNFGPDLNSNLLIHSPLHLPLSYWRLVFETMNTFGFSIILRTQSRLPAYQSHPVTLIVTHLRNVCSAWRDVHTTCSPA
uniref:Uncharacterized protein n=1 Tax=Cacopsylla melanoneura TaxID=428564 RepID=A0A8D9E545_9HEMI